MRRYALYRVPVLVFIRSITYYLEGGDFIPVLHEAGFPFAGDLLCGALDGQGGG